MGEHFYIESHGIVVQHMMKYVGNTANMWNVTMVNQHCPAVLFDGYPNGPSTKDTTQNRRSGMHFRATVQVSVSMVFDGQKEDFLSNKENKQWCITLLSDHLKSHRCHTYADLLIVQTAIAAANRTTNSTVLVADDTDILILLCFHTQPTTTKKAPRCWSMLS